MEGKGLYEYQEQGKITENFIEDYKHLCAKIYSHWSLKIDLEEFYGYCLEKIVTRISAFDPKRSNIGNYCYNVILNEARRLYSLDTHLVDAEVEDVLLYQAAPDEALVKDVWKFAIYAYKKGLYVEQAQLLADYQRNRQTPCCKVFCWLRAMGRL